jgi:hypothetical protein
MPDYIKRNRFACIILKNAQLNLINKLNLDKNMTLTPTKYSKAILKEAIINLL